MVLPQRHKVGTTDFILPDNELTIIAGGDKPIKFVTEGDALVIAGNPLDQKDLTHEYLMGVRYGMGILTASNTGIGRYQMTA